MSTSLQNGVYKIWFLVFLSFPPFLVMFLIILLQWSRTIFITFEHFIYLFSFFLGLLEARCSLFSSMCIFWDKILWTGKKTAGKSQEYLGNIIYWLREDESWIQESPSRSTASGWIRRVQGAIAGEMFQNQAGINVYVIIDIHIVY